MEQEQNHNHEEHMEPEQHAQEEASVEHVSGDNHEHSKNIVIVSVLAIIVVVLALMYMWGSNVQNKSVVEEIPTASLPKDDQVEQLRQVSTSDNIVEIEADLNMTELDTLDADLEKLEAEIDASVEE